MAKRVVSQRSDCKWAWRLVADNNRIIAVDGSQGFENESDALSIADAIIRDDFRDADKRRAENEDCLR